MAAQEITVGEDGPEAIMRVFPRRECLCPHCHDDCVTVTRSEYCSDCEVRHAALGSACH